MSDTETSKRRRRRRLHWHAGFWMLVAILLASGFVVLASMSLTGRVLVLPASVTEKVSARMNGELTSGSVSLGRIELGMTPRGRPRLKLVNLDIRDDSGLSIAQINAVEGGVRPLPLLAGRIEPSTIYLSGAQITIRRRANGDFDLSFGRATGASGDLASVLDAIDKVFTEGPLARIGGIRADALTITLEDARSGRLWQVTEGELQLNQTEETVDITVSFDVFNQTEELAETVLGFRSDKRSSQASFGATFRNAIAADIAAQSPVLAFLGVVDSPISGALRTEIDAEGQIADLAGTLELGAGALSPAPGARPVRFDGAKIYVDYDPARERLNFSEISVTSEIGTARGEGHAYLRNYVNGWPAALVGQLRLTNAVLNPPDVFEAPVLIDAGMADFRLRLDPFSVELGQAVIRHDGNNYQASGVITAGRSGWGLALDVRSARVTRAQVLALWPLVVNPGPRLWYSNNVLAGEALEAYAAFRLEPGQAPHVSVGAAVHGARIRVMPQLAPVEEASGYLSIENKRFVAVVESGSLPSPNGEALDMAGSVFSIPHMHPEPFEATVNLAAAGSVEAMLALLAAEPFHLFRDSELGPDLASGRARLEGQLDMNMFKGMTIADVDYAIDADLVELRSDVLVPGRQLTVPAARLHATNAAVEIIGDGRLGGIGVGGTWRQRMGPENRGRSRLEGWMELSPAFLEEFDIDLPQGTVEGRGTARITLDMAPGAAPAFTMISDLNRVGLSLPDLGWAKPRNATGHIEVEGVLGERPALERIEIDVPGLKAEGQIRLAEGGGLEEARFDRVQMGEWLDAPIRFTPTGNGDAVEIIIAGGRADLSRASFSAGGVSPGGGEGPDLPVTVVLDEVVLSRGVRLTSLSGKFNRKGGFNGTFTALVDDGPTVSGVVAPQPDGVAIRITSDDAGGVLRQSGVFRSAQGGSLALILAPRPGEGVYEGKLEVTQTRVREAPALIELLSAISVIGILEQLDGEGLQFTEVDARFRMTPETVTVYRASAIGPSLGLSLDGVYDLTTSTMDLQGVLSPFYLVNALGQIFTRKGEGLIGFNFTMEGAYTDPKISVNPLSILTPAMFRELFRRPPPEIEE
jgi:hypothetical protein